MGGDASECGGACCCLVYCKSLAKRTSAAADATPPLGRKSSPDVGESCSELCWRQTKVGISRGSQVLEIRLKTEELPLNLPRSIGTDLLTPSRYCEVEAQHEAEQEKIKKETGSDQKDDLQVSSSRHSRQVQAVSRGTSRLSAHSVEQTSLNDSALPFAW